ncbi:MAG: alpha/beta hydrolase [Phycisphaerae bacterium]|nr:alpha/beta hydrolase [Phycisphaerae bacterium]
MMTRSLQTLMVLSAVLPVHLGCRLMRPHAQYPIRSLVTAKGDICQVSDLATLLEDTLRAIQNDDECDNLIVFVHGRGKHPGKAFRQRLLTDLEKDYSAKVIMFHWPSWDGPLGFPEQAARDSAQDFITVLAAIKTFKRTHPDLIQNVRFTLLTQSMGSLVLEESVLRLRKHPMGALFDTLVISASASDTRDHAAWVSRLDLADHIYILINRDDPVLGSAGLKEKGRRLGQGLKSQGKPVKLVDRAVYIDATRITLLHRYYLHRNLRGSPALRRFLDQVLNGQPAALAPDHIIHIHEQDLDGY